MVRRSLVNLRTHIRWRLPQRFSYPPPSPPLPRAHSWRLEGAASDAEPIDAGAISDNPDGGQPPNDGAMSNPLGIYHIWFVFFGFVFLEHRRVFSVRWFTE